MNSRTEIGEITGWLQAWGRDEDQPAEELVRQVYRQLRRQAHHFLRGERANHTLQTTALVHEAYLRLAEQNRVNWQNREQFFQMAARMMRRILVNYALRRNRHKRGGAAEDLPLEDALRVVADGRDCDLQELDNALTRLEQLDERQARIIELRYFSGLSIEDTAQALGLSPATVKRDWQMAKAWLKAELTGG